MPYLQSRCTRARGKLNPSCNDALKIKYKHDGRKKKEAKLSETQKQLFQVGRDWFLSSYVQMLALLQATQACLKDAHTSMVSVRLAGGLRIPLDLAMSTTCWCNSPLHALLTPNAALDLDIVAVASG